MLKALEDVAFILHAGMGTDAFDDYGLLGLISIERVIRISLERSRLGSLCEPHGVLNLVRDDVFS